MRVATIDVGTNTVSLLVADVGACGGLVSVVEREVVTRIGAGVDRSRALDPPAVARTLACLEDFARAIAEARCDRVAMVGTSALRDARGSETFGANAGAIVGTAVRVLSGDEEAEVMFLGATSDARAPGMRVVFDIGGGSTEIVLGDGATEEIAFATSLDMGSVRLTERFLASDPPTSREIEALKRTVADALRSLPATPSPLPPIGVAGTMTTLAAVALSHERFDAALVHGAVVRTEGLKGAVRRLSAMRIDERRRVPAMVAARADVIVAGGVIAIALLKAIGADEVVVSDRGVRWGLATWLARD